MRLIVLTMGLTAGLTFAACGGDTESADIGTSESIPADGDRNDDGRVSYEEESAQSAITTRTTNYTQRADSLRASRDSLRITPKYTDDEYEAAYSTSTTNPRNQSEGGVHPGNPERGKQ